MDKGWTDFVKKCNELNKKTFLDYHKSLINVADAKGILQSNGIGSIRFEYYVDGFMRYRGELYNGNEVIIDVAFMPMQSYQSNYMRDDIDIIDKYTAIIEIKRDKKKSFLFDNPKKGVEGVSFLDDSAKKYYVI
jgi:hypothetical protein